MSGRPFRSLLVPHLSFVRARRQAGATWQEIAAALDREHGIKIGAAGVQRFYARTAKRKAWPLGMEPDAAAPKPAAQVGQEPPAKASLFGGSRRKAKLQVDAQATTHPGPPRPFRSSMNPHLEFIKAQRAARASWADIAAALRTRKGVNVSRQAVAEFYARTQAREQRQRAAAQAQPEAAAPIRPASQGDDPFADDELSQLPPP